MHRHWMVVSCLFLGLTAVNGIAEDWGEPLTLADDSQFSRPDARAGVSSTVVDAIGRLWGTGGDSYGNRYLCTFEDGRWHAVKLSAAATASRQEASLYVGPNGNAVYQWKPQDGQSTIITELRGMRCRHTSPTALPPGELRIYEDSLGVDWVQIGATTGGAAVLLPRPDELRVVCSIKFNSDVMIVTSVGYALRAVSDGHGHYWFSMPCIMTPHAQAEGGLAVADSAGDLNADLLKSSGRGGGNPGGIQTNRLGYLYGASFGVTLIDKEGHVYGGGGLRQPPTDRETFWLGKKDEKSLWAVSYYGIAEIDTATLKIITWWNQNPVESVCIRPGTHRDIDIKMLGDRWLLSTDLGAFWVEKGKLDKLLDGPTQIETAEGGLWLCGTDPDTSLPLAFLPENGSPMRWVGWPQGVHLPERAVMSRTATGMLCFHSTSGILSLTAEEERQLLSAAPAVPAELRCRLFADVSVPLTAPNGDILLFAHAPKLLVHRLSGGAWSEWSPTVTPPMADCAWFVVDDRNRIWMLTQPDGQDEQRYLIHDPATGKDQNGESLKAALDDAALCPDHFLGSPGDHRVPVVGKDGFAAVVTDRTLQCRVKGAWLPQVHYLKSFADDAPLNGACYLDEQGRLCAETSKGVFALAPGEMLFKSATDLPRRYPQAPAPAQDTPAAGTDGLHCEDAQGVTWRVENGALIRSAFGQSAVAVQAAEVAPFREWKTLASAVPDGAGGVFLRETDRHYANTVHVRDVYHPLETKATAAAEASGMVRLRFDDTAGLSHAWRVDQEPWHRTDDKEALAEPCTPGQHVMEVYAFDAQLNLDPAPKRMPVTIAGGESAVGVIDVVIHGNPEQQKWGIETLKKDPNKGIETVRRALGETKDERARWVLESVLQQLNRPGDTSNEK